MFGLQIVVIFSHDIQSKLTFLQNCINIWCVLKKYFFSLNVLGTKPKNKGARGLEEPGFEYIR